MPSPTCVLRAVAEREGFGNLVTVEELADATGLTHEQVDTELVRLLGADYIVASDYSKTAAAGKTRPLEAREPGGDGARFPHNWHVANQ